MNDFDFNEYCNQRLFKDFPELRNNPKYKEIIKNGLNIGTTIVYEDAFVPYLLDLLCTDDYNDPQNLDH
jgi:hypothetical protein